MFSATSHLGGNITKSSNATPGLSVGAVSTADQLSIGYYWLVLKDQMHTTTAHPQDEISHLCSLKGHHDQIGQY